MIRFLVPALFALLGLSASASTSNLSKDGLALEGFDPVSYFRPEAKTEGPQTGNPSFQVTQNSATYRFASESNKQEFLKNPSKYVPAFGGWCAYAVAEKKEKVEVDVKSFLIQDGRLLLFFNGIFADTRDKWLHTKSTPAAKFLQDADAHWPEVKNKDS